MKDQQEHESAAAAIEKVRQAVEEAADPLADPDHIFHLESSAEVDEFLKERTGPEDDPNVSE